MARGASETLLVAGGGIGGLAAAPALADKRLAVTVLEKAAAFGEIGAGIQHDALAWLYGRSAVSDWSHF